MTSTPRRRTNVEAIQFDPRMSDLVLWMFRHTDHELGTSAIGREKTVKNQRRVETPSAPRADLENPVHDPSETPRMQTQTSATSGLIDPLDSKRQRMSKQFDSNTDEGPPDPSDQDRLRYHPKIR
jgi:hypothetical protein